eukprot:361916-Chlamydomonas_euryale.AAC.1
MPSAAPATAEPAPLQPACPAARPARASEARACAVARGTHGLPAAAAAAAAAVAYRRRSWAGRSCSTCPTPARLPAAMRASRRLRRRATAATCRRRQAGFQRRSRPAEASTAEVTPLRCRRWAPPR